MDQQLINLDDLKRDIFDEELSQTTREHAYYNYWMQYISSGHVLSRQDITELLRFDQWISSLGDIISHLCQHHQIKLDDVYWMKTKILSGTFAYKQLEAFEVVNNISLGWRTKYAAVSVLKANWAISQVLKAVPMNETEIARQLIASSNLGKNTKRWQIKAISSETNSLRPKT